MSKEHIKSETEKKAIEQIEKNPACNFHYGLLKEYEERMSKAEERINEMAKIKVRNGDGQEHEYDTNEIIVKIYDATLILRDFMKFHIIMKRYKLYYMLASLPFIFLIRSKLDALLLFFDIFLKR